MAAVISTRAMGTRMRSRTGGRFVMAAAAVVFGIAGIPAAASEAPANEHDAAHGKAKVAGTRFVNLDPFTVPFLGAQGPDGQVNLVVALELVDIDRRDAVLDLVPKIRASIYETLFASITNRAHSREIPSNEKLKRFVRKATERVVGSDVVADVLVQQVYENRAVGR
jgi:flagellar basal body-associated protein FliL